MDIWSLGCCIVQMATGRRPWSTLENEWSVMYHVVTGHPPLPDASQLSSLGIDFLKKCFVRNPMKRPTAEELISHAWITSYLESYNEQQVEENEGDIVQNETEDEQWQNEFNPSDLTPRSILGDESPPLMRSVGSSHSVERPLVRSIPNSLALDGMANSHENGPQAQAYFREIAAQHASDAQWNPPSDREY
jgi:mitogen-activated protein kinase kinase kinase